MSDFTMTMSALERSQVEQSNAAFNRSLNGGRVAKQEMGRDEFLTILLKQLTTQDPTDPLKDKDFIAQMAQFSSLEQMTNMAQNFDKLSGLMNSSQAVSSLGRTVEIHHFGEAIRGRVDEVTAGQYPQVMVGGRFYDFGQVQKILLEE